MTDNPVTKEEFFKPRFLGLVRELADPATADPQSLIAIGALARRMMDDAKVKSWAAFKRGQTRALYDATLRVFQKQGNAMVQEKKLRTAYAIQVLAMSLIARTQADTEVEAGDRQLDGIIDLAAAEVGPAEGPPN